MARRRGQVGRDRRRSSRPSAGAAGAGAGAALPPPLVGARLGGGGGVRGDHDLALPGGDRPALQQVRAAPRGQLRGRRCSSWPARPTWTWARSTGWTRAAGPPALNAYVNGLGHSKRVVLYDNLIDGLPRDQVLQVVAHELGHQHHNDLLRGLLWLAHRGAGGDVPGAARWPSGSGAARASATRAPRPGPSALPAIALAVAIVSFGLGDRVATCSRARWRPAPTPSRSTSRATRRRTSQLERGLAAAQHLRPRPAAALADAVRHPPHDAGADRDRARRGPASTDADH